MLLSQGVDERAQQVINILLALLGIAFVIGTLFLLLMLIVGIGDAASVADRVLPDWFKDKFLTLCGVAGFVGLVFAYIYNSGTILAWSLVGIGLWVIAVIIGIAGDLS